MATIEDMIKAKGMPAPHITPEEVESKIASEWYINGATGVVPDDFQPPVPANSPLNLITLCMLVLQNGFTVVGKSACASPENFDAEIGRRIAREDAVRQIWPLLGYELRTVLSTPVLTEADAQADLQGQPRPDFGGAAA